MTECERSLTEQRPGKTSASAEPRAGGMDGEESAHLFDSLME